MTPHAASKADTRGADTRGATPFVSAKRELRRQLKQERSAVPAAERERVDKTITDVLTSLEVYRRARVVLTYLSFGAEVDTHALIQHAWADDKIVGLPRCVEGTRQMEWHRISSFEDLERSRLGMLEPRRSASTQLQVGASTDQLAIVPALSFDPQGYRLGYGGGYYDTFLEHFAGVSVGLCRSHLLRHDLRSLGVIEDHDVPVSHVVTERGILR